MPDRASGRIAHARRMDAELRPEELFDEHGKLRAEYAALAPEGERRMGANPHANGGLLLKELELPAFGDYAVDVPKPGIVVAEATRVREPSCGT